MKLLDLYMKFAPEGSPDECWHWQGTATGLGYGRIYTGGQQYWAHRVAYELAKGPIPADLEIDHLCQVPSCVNPKHLEAVTHTENQLRIRTRQTRCRRAGHDWTNPRNVYVRRNGRRYCAECARIDARERWANREAS